MSAKLLLALLSLSVFYFIFYFADANGLRALGDAAQHAQTLPGLDVPLRTRYTGLAPLDQLLTTLTVFFWPVGDGSQPALTLHSVAFSGTFASAWILVTLESWRTGSAGTAAAFPAVLGLTAQVLTFAFATPLYALLHLCYSTTAASPTTTNMRIPHTVLRALPHVFTVAMFVPSLLMIVPLSETMTHDLKQICIAVWQPWPAYVAVLLVAAYLVGGRGDADARKTASALRYVYAFAFANTAVAHLVSVVLSAATVAVPAVFRAPYREALHPGNVFAAPLPWATPALRVATVGQGVQAFLRWDYLIGSAGVLVWAVSLHRRAHRAAGVEVGLASVLARVAALSVLASPAGAAVELMWEREELFLRDADADRAKAARGKK
ncbi:Epoxide hydrolase aurD [Metarhizium anisopliae]